MNKSLGILLCIIGGLIGGIVSFYILTAFEDETHVVAGITCSFAGFIAFYVSLIILGVKKKHPDKNYNSHMLYIWIVCISIAVGSLFMWAKERHDYHKKQQKQHTQEQVDDNIIILYK